MFEGTLEQFQNCFFSNATYALIEDYCVENNLKFEVYTI